MYHVDCFDHNCRMSMEFRDLRKAEAKFRELEADPGVHDLVLYSHPGGNQKYDPKLGRIIRRQEGAKAWFEFAL